MADFKIKASPDEIQQVVSSVAPSLIPSVTPPPAPPMPTPARAGYGAFASDPLNQSAISKHITPPGTAILPPPPPPQSIAAPQPWNPGQSSPVPPPIANPAQMASANPPQRQWASLTPPSVAPSSPPSLYGVDTIDSPQSSAIIPMGGPQAPQTVNPYGTPTRAEYFAANPSQQARKQFSGGGLVQNLLNSVAAGTLGAAGGMKGNPGLGAQYVEQGAERDARVPEVNAQRYRTAVIQPQIDSLNAQKGIASIAQTQAATAKDTAQTADIAARRQQELAKYGLKTVTDPQTGTVTTVPDTDSPTYKAQQAQQERLAAQTQLLNAQVESTKAQKELREAQTAYNNAKNDPNSPLFKQTSQRLAIAQQNANAAGTRAQAYWGNYLQHSQNLGFDGQVLPGAPLITDDSGQQTAVGSTNAAQAVKGQSNAARFNDVGGSLDSLDSALQDLHKTGGHLNSPAVLQALQDNQTPVAQWIQSQAAKTLTPQEREAVVKVKNAREQIMALRASVGGGVSDAQVNRLVSQVPDGTSPDYDFSKRQIETLKQSIARLTPGVATANKGLTVHGQGKPNNMVPPSQGGNLPAAAAAQLEEGKQHTFNNGQVWTKTNGRPVRIK